MYSTWEAIKKDPSREELRDLDKLFTVFDQVQKAEVGLITAKIDETESLFLFNNLYKTRRIKDQTDIKLIEDWKKFIKNPQIWDSEIIQPIDFSAVSASPKIYNDFFIFRKSHKESQVDKKVETLRYYINKEFGLDVKVI